MKNRRNPFLASATLAAATIMFAGLQSASAVDYDIDTFTGFTGLWTTETIWNPDAGVGVGPLAADSIVIVAGDLTGTTNIDYATGTAADRSITNLTVTDSNNGLGSGAQFNFRAGVVGSQLEFSTNTPTISTNIVNQNSAGNRLAIQNPLFGQANTTLTKGGTGNLWLELQLAAGVTSFNSNVTSITSSGGGDLRLSGPTGNTFTLPSVSFNTNNTRLSLTGAAPFDLDSGKSINTGTNEIFIGAGGTLNVKTGASISGAGFRLSTSNSSYYYTAGSSTLNWNGATSSISRIIWGDQLGGNSTMAVNVTDGTLNITGLPDATFAGNPNADANVTQNVVLNISGGAVNFTNATAKDVNFGNSTRNNATVPGNLTTVAGNLTIAGTGVLDLGTGARLVLARRNATNTIVNVNSDLNLNGGELKTAREIARGTIGTGAGTTRARVFLNGGTLTTAAAVTDLFTAFTGGTDGIFVSNGGAVINTNGFNSAINAVLQQNTASTGGGLNKNGTGTLTLNAANTFTGITTVNGGSLLLGNSLALQNSTFDTSGAGSLNFGLLGTATFGGLSGTSGLVLQNITPDPVALSVGGNNASTSFSGDLSGTGSLTKTGSGILSLSGTNTYAGNTTISGGVLSINTTAALPGYDTTGRYSVANGATLAVGNSVSDGNITTMLGTTNFVASSRIGFDTTDGNRSYGTNIGGSRGLSKVGPNTLTLSAAQTYTGTTALYQGTLALSGSGTLPTATTVTFAGDATLDLGGKAQTVANITNAAGTYSAAATSGDLTLASTGNLNFSPAQTTIGQAVSLDMSGLSSFTYNNATKAFQVGGGGPYGNTLDLRLASGTNTITASNLSLAMGSTTDNGNWPFNGATLRLGTTNTLHVGDGVDNDISLSGYRSSGNTITFLGDPAASTLEIRAADGTSRTGGIAVSTGSSGTNSGQPIEASFDLGIVDALVGDILVADNVQTGTGVTVLGSMTMAGGTLDATSMTLGRVNTPGTPTNVNTLQASFTQNGGTATVPTLTLGNILATGLQTTGTLPLFDSTYTLGENAILQATTINANPDGWAFRSTSLRTLNIEGGTLRNITGGDLTVSGADTIDGGLIYIVLGGTNNTIEATSGQTIDIQATAPISGSGNLVKTGLGTLSLKGANTYSGETLVNAGTLEITTDDTLADGYAVRLAAGTTLNLNFTGEDTVDRLYINGTEQASGTWGSLASSATNKSALITGDGILDVTNGSSGTDDFNSWASSQVPPVTGGINGDDDNDGVPNLIEYALADGQERGSLTGLTLSFTKRGTPFGTDITYAIETSDNLGITDPWATVTPTVNNASTISYTLQNPGDNFARLKVTQNP